MAQQHRRHGRPAVPPHGGQAGPGQAVGAGRVVEQRDDGRGHGLRGARRHQPGVDAVRHDEGHAADVGADHGHAAGQRLEYRVGHVVDQARVECQCGAAQQGRHPVAVEPAGEMHAIGHTQLARQGLEHAPLGAGAGDREARRRMAGVHQRQCAQRRRVVVDRLQVARDDQVRRLRRPGRCGVEALQVDDVGHDLGRHAVLAEYRLQEAGGHDQASDSRHRSRDRRARTREEGGRLAAPVVDQHRHAAQARDPDRRCGEQVPGPAGVGHHVEQIAAPRGAPQGPEVGQQPREGAQHGDAAQERRPVRGIALHERDMCAGGAQQLGQLPGLHRHAAGRRRQRADEPDPQALGGPTGCGGGIHAAVSPRIRPS